MPLYHGPGKGQIRSFWWGDNRTDVTTMDQQFSHTDNSGKLKMVDITAKRPTHRRAHAGCVVLTTAGGAALEPSQNGVDPLHAAKLAGIQAAKETSRLIPLCHPLNIDEIHVEIVSKADRIEILSTVAATHRTGVEMEALAACAFAALSLLQSLRRIDPNARIDDLVLLRKTGGKSGDWGRLVPGPQ
jgi:cyclic pyranopterin phosphate synthase